MKKLFLLMMGLAAFVIVKAQIAPYPQVPAAINYQGVARNSAGQPLANQTIKVYSSIIVPATPTFGGAQFYFEKRTVTTNAFGLFSIQVGSPGADQATGAIPSNAIFQAWGPNLHLHTEIELPSSAPVSLGDTKLASVPYALYSKGARPWSYTVSEEIPGSTNFTVYPDKDYWNLGLGTAQATEKLHVIGKIRMEDGSQANGYVLTSDANGVGTWKPVAAPANVWTRTGNKAYLINSNDSVGIGTSNPTSKLDLVGKFRLRDGSQALGYHLVSDANGLAAWQKPDWTLTDNNIGAGYHVITPTDINRTVGIGISNPSSFVKLHVVGGLRFEGNGPLNQGNVLTVDGFGNAVWQDPSSNPALSYWAPGQFAEQNVIQTRPDLEFTPYFSRSQMIISKDMQTTYPNDFLDVDNYPFVVQNSKHGMAVVINGDAQQDKKFISFFDDGFGTRYRGAIEGQTLLELQNDPDYVAYVTLQTLSTSGFIAEGIACTVQADLFEVAVQVAQASIWGADLGTTINTMESNVGVAYTSGSADYAEWLEKADPAERFTFGDIVSVNGGKISKRLSGGGQLMVISKAPIVLGNIPDEKNKTSYEKVAFMGQVPVKVKGKVAIGDYIVAYPDGTGVGYAINPARITANEMNRIAGVAWSASEEAGFSMINTAVGVNPQAVNHMIQKQENEINDLKNMVNQLSSYLQSKDSSFRFTRLDTRPSAAKPENKPAVTSLTTPAPLPANGYVTFSKLTPEEQMKRLNSISAEKIKKLITENPRYIDAAMKVMREKIEASGQNLNSNPEMKRLLTDRDFMIKTIRQLYKI
ncbi:MAG: hypothetical protein U0U70_17365 [Chitinophagaceae bacterium]